ncbi:MAG: glycine cleavage system protein GcvH [Cyclobacteriaceae bacterium]|nr:glycine cleavage system protein GcvH [Cyclobacteriaceae bacterium]
MNLPAELKYSKDHEWIKVNDDNTALIGITDFAQGELGDIVYVEVETEGDDINQGEVFGTIEAVKTVSDLYMPVDGTVLEVNSTLEDQPELVNSSPYEDGWIIKIKINDLSAIENLLSADQYREIIGA